LQLRNEITLVDNGGSPANLVQKLRRLMIRHTKSQRIRGTSALVLPEKECETVWLTMSADEATLYAMHCCADGVPAWADRGRTGALTLSDLNEGIGMRRSALAHLYNENAVTGASAKREASLTSPAPGGMRPAACAAFSRLATTSLRARSLTKYKALTADLAALRASTPDASVVIFTHHTDVLTEVVAMLKDQGMAVYQVSRADPAPERHKMLREFQNGGDGKGGTKVKVLATTFATAAVGLSLTAASRVYLLEASLDPAQEAQAAGRIHRLGQTKAVFVKRYLYKNSLDEAVHDLHAKIKDGSISLADGTFPPEALELFKRHGVAQPHTADDATLMREVQRRYRSRDMRNRSRHGEGGQYDFGKRVMTRTCATCAKPMEVAGTSVWWGRGRWEQLTGDTSDDPVLIRDQRDEHFGAEDQEE